MRTDHVQIAIPAGSEDTARAFWCDLIGMTEIEKPDALKPRGGLWLRSGNVELHLGVDHGFQPAKKAHPGFAMEDLAALAARLEAGTQPVTWDTDIPGRDRFFTEDPFGNRLEFIQDT